MKESKVLRDQIEGGESVVYAFEQADLDKMREDGEHELANQIEQCLDLVDTITTKIGVRYD